MTFPNIGTIASSLQTESVEDGGNFDLLMAEFDDDEFDDLDAEFVDGETEIYGEF